MSDNARIELLLAHILEAIDQIQIYDTSVWNTVEHQLPALRRSVAQLLG